MRSIHEFAAIKTGPYGTLLEAHEYSGDDEVPMISVGEIRERFLRITEHIVVGRRNKETSSICPSESEAVFGRKGGVERSALIRQQQDAW